MFQMSLRGPKFLLSEQACDHDTESMESNGSDLDKELNGKRSSDNSMESDVQEITIELHKTNTSFLQEQQQCQQYYYHTQHTKGKGNN